VSCTIKHSLTPLSPEVKSWILRVLRDSALDMSLKQTVVDEVIRLIACQAVTGEEVSNYIAALLLQYFERPDSEQVMDPATRRLSHRAKHP